MSVDILITTRRQPAADVLQALVESGLEGETTEIMSGRINFSAEFLHIAWGNIHRCPSIYS
jgi:hypothetical protein